MATEDVHVKVCQQEIVKLDLQIKAVIQDIHGCEGPVEVLQDLNRDIRVKIKSLQERISELEDLAQQQDKETDKIVLMKDVENHRLQLDNASQSLRQANVACHIALQKKEKDMLMYGGSTELRQRGKSNKEGIAKTASTVTENLMGLCRMMSAEVERGQLTVNTLVTSSKQLTDTGDEFKTMSGHISNSRKLLTKYSRREFTDKLLIFLALVFFFATVLYIMKKRLFSSET